MTFTAFCRAFVHISVASQARFVGYFSTPYLMSDVVGLMAFGALVIQDCLMFFVWKLERHGVRL